MASGHFLTKPARQVTDVEKVTVTGITDGSQIGVGNLGLFERLDSWHGCPEPQLLEWRPRKKDEMK